MGYATYLAKASTKVANDANHRLVNSQIRGLHVGNASQRASHRDTLKAYSSVVQPSMESSSSELAQTTMRMMQLQGQLQAELQAWQNPCAVRVLAAHCKASCLWVGAREPSVQDVEAMASQHWLDLLVTLYVHLPVPSSTDALQQQ